MFRFNDNSKLRIITFIVFSYIIALLLDLMAFKGFLTLLLWGFLRMWSVTLSIIICLIIFKEDVSSNLRRFLIPTIKSIKLYLISPLIVYLALGVYIALTIPLGLFDFSIYIELISEIIPREQARIVAFLQIISAYIAAITINAIFALGEELGWRGYLYDLLKSKPLAIKTIIIGVVWGLWHASAIILLGYNYQVNRLIGIPLFTISTIFITYPQLLLTIKADGNVLPSSSFHGAINSLWNLTIIATRLPIEIREILLGLGFMGIISWIITNTILYLLVKRRYPPYVNCE